MRIRVVVRKHDDDPAKDLEVAGRLRFDLWAHSPVEVDPDDPSCATRRNSDGEAFFEFDTDVPDEVRRVVRDYGHAEAVRLLAGGELQPLNTD